MRVLAVLFVLLSLPVLAADGHELLAQQKQQQSGSQGSSSQPTRHPGDYCCRHCRAEETPCGTGCLAKGKACSEKRTCACSAKP